MVLLSIGMCEQLVVLGVARSPMIMLLKPTNSTICSWICGKLECAAGTFQFFNLEVSSYTRMITVLKQIKAYTNLFKTHLIVK